jgi:hypothetical protein
VHEIIAALVPGNAPPSPPREIVGHVEVVRIARRRLSAAPRIVRIATVRPAPMHRIARHRARIGGHSASAAHAPAHRTAIVAYSGRPVWDTGSGRGIAPNGVAGSGAQSAGAQGAGTDAASGKEPCGFVEFSDPHGSQYDRGTGGFYVDIRMSVHFADGSQQSMVLDYPWYYASENANPWSAHNIKDPNFPTRFQPPPAAKLSDEPQLVQYVAQHSTADGMTLLRDCQGATEQRP